MKLWKWKPEYTAILFIAGICANLLIALLNGILGYFNSSVWQGTISAYYLFIMLLKLGLLIGSIKSKKNIRSLTKCHLYVSIAIMLLDLILGVIVYLMATDRGSKHYPGYLIYGVALYAFCKMISGGINLVKAGRKNSPVLLSMKSIGLVDAMVSILMLEIALIDTFGDINTEWARTMMAASGFGVWLVALAVGVLGVRCYLRRKI